MAFSYHFVTQQFHIWVALMPGETVIHDARHQQGCYDLMPTFSALALTPMALALPQMRHVGLVVQFQRLSAIIHMAINDIW